METFIFYWWWRSHQSLAREGLRILRFCIVSWKDEREPSIKYGMGRQIDVVQKFTRIQSSGQNWWWANGIRVEYFPRIQQIAAQPQSPRVAVKIECNTKEIYWTDHLHVDIQRHPMVIERQQERMRGKCSTRLSLCKEIRSRTMVISRSWFRETVVFYQWRYSAKWMGPNGWEDDGETRRKRTPSLPSHESIVPRSAWKQRWWKIVDTLMCRPGDDWNSFSHKLLL